MDWVDIMAQLCGMMIFCKFYLFNVSDEDRALVKPCLTLLPEDAGQREMFNGLRSMVKTGAPWGRMPNDLPPWAGG